MKTENRQIALLILTFIAFAFLAWQVYTLVRTDIMPSNVANARPITTRTTTIPVPPPKKQLPSRIVSEHVSLTAQQKKYMELVTKYQLAKMERQLLEEEAGIAFAQQRIAMLNLKTKKLIGGNFQKPFGTSHNQKTNNKTDYHLSYIDHQGDKWSATLYKDGQYQEVSVGSQLDNGERIIGIDQQGVVLQKSNKQLRLTFNGIKIKSVASAQKKTTPHKHKVVQSQANIATVHYHKPRAISAIPVASDFYNLSKIQNNLMSIPSEPPKIKKINHKSKKIVVAQERKKPTKKPPKPIELTMKAPTTNAPPKKIQSYTLDEILLLELPPSSYTIELKSSYNKAALEQLAEINNLGAKATYYSTLRGGKTWFTLVYDHFNTRKEAESELRQLPETLLQQKPQLQMVSTIQQAIKTQRG